jgi:hypothetical protein
VENFKTAKSKNLTTTEKLFNPSISVLSDVQGVFFSNSSGAKHFCNRLDKLNPTKPNDITVALHFPTCTITLALVAPQHLSKNNDKVFMKWS